MRSSGCSRDGNARGVGGLTSSAARCRRLTGALAVLLAASAPALADSGNATCLRDRDIVNTTRPDDFTILFEMRGHQIWKNTLPSRCFGLHNEAAGFTYQPTDPGTDEICSNQVTIKLNTFGSFCLLGPFVRVK